MSSEMIVTFPGGKQVDTRIGAHEIRTDQPASGGGQDSAPSPFQLFLAAIGTCAGIYVAGFCQKRELPTEGIRIRQRNHFDPETRRARPRRARHRGAADASRRSTARRSSGWPTSAP